MPPSGKKSGIFHWFWRVRYWITVACLAVLGGAVFLFVALGDDAPAWSRNLLKDYAPWNHPETQLIWAPWTEGEIDWSPAEEALKGRLGPGKIEDGLEDFRSFVKRNLPEKGGDSPAVREKRDYLLRVYRERAARTEQAIAKAKGDRSRTPREIEAAEQGLEKLKKGIRYLETLPENLSGLDSTDPAKREAAESELAKNPFR